MIFWDSMLQRQQSWNETNKHMDDQSYPQFVIFSLLIQKREVYHYAQVNFDFGQVHIVWWLLYWQAGEKISIEPWLDMILKMQFSILFNPLLSWDPLMIFPWDECHEPSELMPDILKMVSWVHMERTANIIIFDTIHIFASISKIMRILLMGWRNRERWALMDDNSTLV